MVGVLKMRHRKPHYAKTMRSHFKVKAKGKKTFKSKQKGIGETRLQKKICSKKIEENKKHIW